MDDIILSALLSVVGLNKPNRKLLRGIKFGFKPHVVAKLARENRKLGRLMRQGRRARSIDRQADMVHELRMKVKALGLLPVSPVVKGT